MTAKAMTFAEWQEWCKNHRAKFNMGQPNKDGSDAASLLLGEMWTCIFGPAALERHHIVCTVEELEEASVDMWTLEKREEAIAWSEHARLLRRWLSRRWMEKKEAREQFRLHQEREAREKQVAEQKANGTYCEPPNFAELLAARLPKVEP